ncbi:MAG: alpha-2-macroglobulin family protein, partial [Polyangiaceae bacterium]
QLGSTTMPLIVKQDFFVEASLPPVLTQGDEIAVPVTVFSYAGGPQDVTLALEGDGISVVGSATTALHLGPREARGVRFTVRADKAGERVLRLKATSPTRGDAIERKITVTPNGLAVIRTVNGRLTGSTQASLELPKNAIDGGNDLYVKVYGGPLSQVSEGLDGVFHLPHGCFEQTSSTTYPSVLALDFLGRTKAVSPELERKARGYIGEGYQRLVSFEVPGGGFSLYGKSPASTTLTAYGLMEFADMSRVSSVDEVLIERTRDWLFKKRTATGGWANPAAYDPDGKKENIKDDVLVTAYVAWAIAESRSTPNPETDPRLQSVLDVVTKAPSPEGDDPYALALRANALLAGGRTKDARVLLDRLAPQAVRGEDGIHFTSRAVGVMYSYGDSLDIEVTGLATHAFALAAMQPELRAGALDWIVARRSSYGTWSTTQATVAAMRALLDEAKPAPNAPQDITVLVDGESVETFRMEPKGRDVHHLVGLRRFATTGKHLVELRATGAGDVSFQLVGAHYVPWQHQPDAGLALDVAYAPSAVLAGTTTSCHVRLGWTGKEAARMPLVEIGIPPAFEVESDDLEALLGEKSTSGIERYTVDGGKVTLYLSRLAAGKPLAIDLRLRAL